MEDTKVKCAKCFKEMEEGKYKTCDKCGEYMRANHQKNKEIHNERRREYYYNHIEEAKEYARNYGRTHREEINERRRNHRAENIEQVNAKIKWMTCPVCDDYEIQCKNYWVSDLSRITYPKVVSIMRGLWGKLYHTTLKAHFIITN